jgi:hypothetical protein
MIHPRSAELVSPLLTPEQTADLLDSTPAELVAQRAAGTGPAYHPIGFGTIRYNTASVMRWQTLQTAKSAPHDGQTLRAIDPMR